MKKLNKKYADLLHQASIATGRKEAIGLLHKAAKLQSKFDEKSNKLQENFQFNFVLNRGINRIFNYLFHNKKNLRYILDHEEK